MKKLLLILCTILTACAPAVRIPDVVKIPVPVTCPEPQPVNRPHLLISDLPAKPGADQYVRAVESSLEALMGYAEELEKTLRGYRK